MTTPPPVAISVRGLTRRLRSGDRELTVLNEVSFDIPHGVSVAILGPSGSGKSTLLALLAGLDRPSAGEVVVDGRAVHALDEDALARWRRTSLGFVFQSFQLLDTFTARENVMFPLELLDTPPAEARARADGLLNTVGLGERGHHYPSQLSGGEQQRVAVARAFAARPGILLADEPTGNLDGPTGQRVLEALDRLQAESGCTIVMVTHDPAIGARADVRILLRDGQIERIEGIPGAAE
jgi:putative ABC transport system ATP-binding protein